MTATRPGVVALAMIVTSAAAAQQATVTRTPEALTLERRVDSVFTSQISQDGPGCAVGIYKNGDIVFGRGYGLAGIESSRPITPRTTFALGSVSKPFTALAVLMLDQQGRLSLDDDVRRWVPELPNYGSPIRIRDLVQHSSGLRDYSALGILSGRSVTTMSEFLGVIAAQRALNFAPGTKHEYSHSDYVLLGLIVERVVGIPFGEHLEREVLKPMGMNDSFVNDARPRSTKDRAFGHFVSTGGARVQFPASQIVGGGNLYASIEDLARWDRNFDQPAVGGHAVMARMLELPQLASGDTVPYAYGLRLGRYRGLRTIARGGHTGGTRTEIIRFADHAFTVATLCNADMLEAGKLAQRVADIYLGGLMRAVPPRPSPPSPVAVSPTELSRYVGVYASYDEPWNLLPIEMRNGQLVEILFHDATDDTLFALTPAGDGRFFEIGLTGNVGIFTFRSTAPGGPLRLEISWNGGPAETLHRVAESTLWRPQPAALAEYAGTWYSDELDAGWRFDVGDGRLVLNRSGQHEISLRPVVLDQFVRGFGPWQNEFTAQLRFHRDEAGKLTHLTVSTPPGEDSARDVRFIPVGKQ